MNKIILCSLILILRQTVSGQTEVKIPFFNDAVNSMVVSGDTIFVGGNFTKAFPFDSSARYGGAVNMITGVLNPNWANPNGHVNYSLPDGTGGLYICGEFTRVGDSTRNCIAHLNASGQVTNMFASLGFNHVVNTMVKQGDTLYVAGDFTAAGSSFSSKSARVNKTNGNILPSHLIKGAIIKAIPDGKGGFFIAGQFSQVGDSIRNNLAQIDSTGKVTAWSPNPNGKVTAIGFNGGSVFIGGDFTAIKGERRRYLAAVSAVTGNVTLWNPNSTYDQYTINDIVVKDSTVFIGGIFSTIKGVSRSNLAALDTTLGVVRSWNADADRVVNVLAISGNTLLVGGDFTSLKGQPRNSLGGIDITTSAVSPWLANADATVYSIHVKDRRIYVGGSFDIIQGQARKFIACIDTTTKAVTSWDPDVQATSLGEIRTIFSQDNTVYVGGYFHEFAGVDRNNIVAFDTSGTINTLWQPIISGRVDNVSVSGGGVLLTCGSLGGAYIRNRVAAIKISTGTLTSFNPSVNSNVEALCVRNDVLFLGGNFSKINGQTRNFVGAVNAVTGIVLPWNPNANGRVSAILAKGDTVFLGGSFTSVNLQSRNKLAAITYNTATLAWWFTPNPDGNVNVLIRDGNTLFVGGEFSNISSSSRGGIACYNLSTMGLAGWSPASGFPRVLSLAIFNNSIYAAGYSSGGNAELKAFNKTSGAQLTSWQPSVEGWRASGLSVANASELYIGGCEILGGCFRQRLAAFNSTTGQLLNWQPSSDGEVKVIYLKNNQLYLSGNFTTLNGISRQRLGCINSQTGVLTSWSPTLAGPASATVMESIGDTLYIGGEFDFVNGISQKGFAALYISNGLLASWNPTVDNWVYDILIKDSALFICGMFNWVNGIYKPYVASINMFTKALNPFFVPFYAYGYRNIEILDSIVYLASANGYTNFLNNTFAVAYNRYTIAPVNWNPRPNTFINDLKRYDNYIFAAGYFTEIGKKVRTYVAVLDKDSGFATEWSSLPYIGTGLNDVNHSNVIIRHQNKVFTSGRFSSVEHSVMYNYTNIVAIKAPVLNPIPVKMIRFAAIKSNKAEVILWWQTASEENNQKFEIERSTDNKIFEKIASVRGNGTTMKESRYTFTDANVESEFIKSGVLYYRLKQIDFNGKYKYSDVAIVTDVSNINTDQFFVHPNPSNASIVIVGLANEAAIFDMLGNKIMQINQDGEQDVSSLKEGIYFIRSDNQTQKFVKY